MSGPTTSAASGQEQPDERPIPNEPPRFQASLRRTAYAPRGLSPTGAGAAPGDAATIDLAEEFHEASKVRALFPAAALGPNGREFITVAESHLNLGRKALAISGPRVHLARPDNLPVDLIELAHRRRSGLPERSAPVGLEQLQTVLALAAGPVPGRPDVRTTPSAGALYPLDVVVIAHSVDGLLPGAYVYDPIEHSLLPRGDIDPSRFHDEVGATIAPHRPAVTLVLVASFARSRTKYGLRGYRFTLLEAGHVVQAALTAATALGLATLPWGGFIDSAADRLLELDGLERGCVYLLGLSRHGDGSPGHPS